LSIWFVGWLPSFYALAARRAWTTPRPARQSKVADDLSLVNGQQTLDGLHLYNELRSDHEVHPIATFELYALEADR